MARNLTVQRESSRHEEIQAYRIKDFCRLYGIGRTSAYALIAEGKLATIKLRGMRLIPRQAAAALFSKEASK